MNKPNVAIDVPIPQVLVDNFQREQGLILMAGNRYSAIEKTIEFLFHRYRKQNGPGVFISRDNDPSEGIKHNFHLSSFEDLSLGKNRQAIKNSSLLVIENVQTKDELLTAVNLQEEGRLVILQISAPSLLTSLHRIFGLALQTQNSHLLWRVVEGLILLFSQTRVNLSAAEALFAHEVVLASPEVKKCLWAGELKEFEQLTRTAGEHSGIVTLNQSLLQLLIRRRIEIKTAFEISRDPVDLDHLLKKVGV